MMGSTRSMTGQRRLLTAAVGLIAVGSLALGACSSDSDASSADRSTTSTINEATTAAPADNASLEPSGPGCAAVPESGAGSFADMAQDPAATAASNNPALSTLVTAVTKADLVDTLNGEGPFTIFAPINSAFEAIPADTLNAVLADQAQLTDILTYHVVPGEKLSSEDLISQGSAKTVEGKELTFTKDGDTIKVNGSASVVCADVPTANATVFLIDSVLMPPA